MDFVSPENEGECLRLTEEFRTLPPKHKYREDKLEVKKIIVHVVCNVVKEICGETTLPNQSKWEDQDKYGIVQSHSYPYVYL